jgi:hypothetical protein
MVYQLNPFEPVPTTDWDALLCSTPLTGSGIHYSISIIDEDDNYYPYLNSHNLDWQSWSNKTDFTFTNAINSQQQQTSLANVQDKRFILLVPQYYGYTIYNYPSRWPRLFDAGISDIIATTINVARYDGYGSVQAPSDYYSLIQVATGISWSAVQSVVLAVDNSGSMVRDTVAPDVDTFCGMLTQQQIPFIEISIPSERWIYPHT